MLFSRRHPVAISFQKWAIEKLFILSYGTANQKDDLAADVLGVNPKALRSVLHTNVNAMPVVYLFGIGSAGDLRKTLNIPDTINDNDIVVKYGLTNDLKRRTQEHENALGKISPNNRFGLIYHVYIDPFFLSQAESDIKKYFIGAQWHLRHPKYTELAAIPQHMINSIVHNEFKRLGGAYAGKLQDLQNQLLSEQKVNEQLRAHLEAQERFHIDAIASRDKLYETVMYEKDARLREKDEMLNIYKSIFMNRAPIHNQHHI